MTPRYGITVPFEDVPLHAQRQRHERLADLGYTDAWSSEANGADALTPLALAAAWAPRLRIGTAIMPAFTRGPAVIAQSAAALASAAPGGFACGIGASSAVIVERWNGLAFDRPYTRMRDLVLFLGTAFTGAKVTATYETFAVNGFRLTMVPETPPPILVAAQQRRMLELGAYHADGVILNWVAASDVATIVREIAPPASAEVIARIPVVPIADAEYVRDRVRPLVASYLTVPSYAAAQEWFGRGELLEPMQRAWAAGDRADATHLVPDSVIDAMIVHGSPEACRARIDEFVHSGVTTPVIAILPMFDLDIDASLADLAVR